MPERFVPYIYSTDELQRLISPTSPEQIGFRKIQPHTLRAVLLLLYGVGLRICEAVALTLQGFFEALPRPLPEPVDDKTVAEINAPGWLNGLIQSARGGKLEHKFIWTADTKLGSMLYSFPSPFALLSVYNPCIAH